MIAECVCHPRLSVVDSRVVAGDEEIGQEETSSELLAFFKDDAQMF